MPQTLAEEVARETAELGQGSPLVRFTDRSRVIAAQRCPRQRYWQYQHAKTGIEARRIAVPLATGGAVHAGLAKLLQGSSVTTAVAAGVAFLQDAALSRGFLLDELEQESQVYAEQLALTEALVRLAHLRVLPDLLRLGGRFLPEWTEREVSREMQNNSRLRLVYNSRPDGVLESPDGERYILSWKTAAQYDSRKDADARVDMQGLAEAWASEPELGPVAGVQMVYLLKGRRVPSRKTKGVWETHSPLIRGWKNLTGPTAQYATHYEWTEEDPELGGAITRRLGKGWIPFAVSAEMGVERWMEMLNSRQVQPEAGDQLAQQYVIPVPYYRKAQDIERWRRQTLAQESRIALASGDLDAEFPQFTHSCAYPSKCQFSEICWGSPDVAEDPLASGLYQIRTPNHPEAENAQD